MRPPVDQKSRLFDLAVLGADDAGLAAAAAVARLGRSAAIIPLGVEGSSPAPNCEPQNFVWRTLDLHRHLTAPEPFQCEALLGERTIVLPAASRGAADALAARAPDLDRIYAAFLDAESVAPVHESANAALDDWFDDEALKTLLLLSRLGALGLSGDEPGGATLMANGAAAPLPTKARAALSAALARIAADADVVRFDAPLASAPSVSSKVWRLLAGEEAVRARRVMVSSAAIGRRAGLAVDAQGPLLVRREGLSAIVRMRFKSPPAFADAPAATLAYVAADRAAVRRARDAMHEGRIIDDAPLCAEISGAEIIVRAPYCPSFLVDDGERRDWSGQDRQAFARDVARRIEKRLTKESGRAADVVCVIEHSVVDRARRTARRGAAAPAPLHSSDAIGAAVRLALELAGDE